MDTRVSTGSSHSNAQTRNKSIHRDFALKGAELRRQGINRIGNLLVPNDNYCRFEDWVNPILHAMADEQVRAGCACRCVYACTGDV